MKIFRFLLRFLLFLPMAIFAYLGIGFIALSLLLAETIVLIPVAMLTFLCGALCMGITYAMAVAYGAEEKGQEYP